MWENILKTVVVVVAEELVREMIGGSDAVTLLPLEITLLKRLGHG